MEIIDNRKKAPTTFGDLQEGDWFIWSYDLYVEAPRLKVRDGFICIVPNARKSFFTAIIKEVNSWNNEKVERIDVKLIIENPK